MAAHMTNAIREAQRKGVAVTIHSFEPGDEHMDACAVARALAVEPSQIYKTLIFCRDGRLRDVLVACVPGPDEVDPKALARAAYCARTEMIPLKELTALTGYIRGACSPLAMKKHYPFFLHDGALQRETIIVSAGRRGLQMELSPQDLLTLTNGLAVPLVRQGDSHG